MSENKTPSVEEVLNNAPETTGTFAKSYSKLRELVVNLVSSVKLEQNRKQAALGKLKNSRDILMALGYTTDGHISTWSHRDMQPCPGCHGRPIIQQYKYGDGWVAICEECSHRTEAQLTPDRAVAAWVAGEWTPESEMTMTRLDGSPRPKKRRAQDDDT